MPGRKSRYLQMAAYVLLAVIFIFVIGITRNCSRLPAQATEGYSGGDTLDIAMIFVPGSFFMEEDSLVGINHQLAEIYSEESGIPVKVWPITEPSDGLSKLDTGAFDILASLPLDNYLRKNYPVSESVFLDRLVLIQINDSLTNQPKVKSSLDLHGTTVYVPAGSSAVQRMKNLSEEIGGEISIIEVPEISDELLSLQVATGKVPLAVVNESVAKAVAENYPNLLYDSSVSFTQFQVWVFNPSDSTVAVNFNQWFDDFRTTDRYRHLINRF